MHHLFDSKVAAEFGLIEAILIQNFQFWIEHNRSNGKHLHDGRTWTYNSVRAFGEIFPYMGRKQIYNALKKLETSGVLMTGNYSTDHRDQTTWYAFTDEERWMTGIFRKGKSELIQKGKSSIIQKGNCSITDNKPDEKQVSAPSRGDKMKPVNKPELPPRPYWQKMIDTWYEDYRVRKKGEVPTIAGRNLTHFGKLYDLLQTRAKNKKKEWTEEHAVSSFIYFLQIAYSDKWLSEHWLLANLVEQFDAIYAREAIRKQAAAPNAGQPCNQGARSVYQEIDYLVGRHAEYDFDEQIIRPDHYDMLTGRGMIPVGTMANFPADNHDESKRLAVLAWLKSMNKRATV